VSEVTPGDLARDVYRKPRDRVINFLWKAGEIKGGTAKEISSDIKLILIHQNYLY
jgi:hypothetical protein